MARTPKHKRASSEKKSNVPEKQIAKDESEVSTHPDRMTSRRKSDQDKSKEGGIAIMKNRSQNEESEVTNHADSMASRRKKDQDKSAEGGTWYYKNRSEIEEN